MDLNQTSVKAAELEDGCKHSPSVSPYAHNLENLDSSSFLVSVFRSLRRLLEGAFILAVCSLREYFLAASPHQAVWAPENLRCKVLECPEVPNLGSGCTPLPLVQ